MDISRAIALNLTSRRDISRSFWISANVGPNKSCLLGFEVRLLSLEGHADGGLVQHTLSGTILET